MSMRLIDNNLHIIYNSIEEFDSEIDGLLIKNRDMADRYVFNNNHRDKIEWFGDAGGALSHGKSKAGVAKDVR